MEKVDKRGLNQLRRIIMGNQYSKCDDCYKTHLPEAHDKIIVLPSEAFSEGYVPLKSSKAVAGWAEIRKKQLGANQMTYCCLIPA